jgi:hypothetical protein
VKGAETTDNFKQRLEKIDFVGAAFLLISNLSFVTGVSLGDNTHEWSDPFIVVF